VIGMAHGLGQIGEAIAVEQPAIVGQVEVEDGSAVNEMAGEGRLAQQIDATVRVADIGHW